MSVQRRNAIGTLLQYIAIGMALIFAAPALAEKRQLGNIIYEVPQGWRAGKYDPEKQIRHHYTDDDDVPCEYCRLIIHRGTARKGSIQDWMRSRMDASLEEDDAKQLEMMQQKTSKVGLIKLHMQARLVDDDGKRVQVFVGVELPRHYELIELKRFIYNADDAQEVLAVTPTILKMLSSARFVSASARPLVGKPQKGPLEGVYWGFYTYNTIGIDGMIRFEVSHKTYSFYPSGRFYKGVAPEGYSQFDYDKAEQYNPLIVGNYEVHGKRIKLRYADGKEDELTIDGKFIEDGSANMEKMTLPPPGFRFEAEKSNVFFSGFSPGSGIGGGMSSSSSWVFLKDGTYVSDSFTGVSATFDSGGYTYSKESADKRGRYEVADGIITLTPPQGPAEKWSFFLNDYKGEQQIVVNGKVLSDKDEE